MWNVKKIIIMTSKDQGSTWTQSLCKCKWLTYYFTSHGVGIWIFFGNLGICVQKRYTWYSNTYTVSTMKILESNSDLYTSPVQTTHVLLDRYRRDQQNCKIHQQDWYQSRVQTRKKPKTYFCLFLFYVFSSSCLLLLARHTLPQLVVVLLDTL